jgi:hypothetical protein
MYKPVLLLIAFLSFFTGVAALCALTPAAPAVEPTATVTEAPPTDTAEPTSTQTATPTTEPTATETAAPTATRGPDRKATEQAKSTQAAEKFFLEIGEELETVGVNPEIGYLMWVQDRPVVLEMDSYGDWFFDPFADGMVASDFVLKTDVTWESSSGLATCGFIFRSEKNIEIGKQYYFEMLRLSGLPAWDIVYLKDNFLEKNVSEIRTNSAIHQEQGSKNEVILIAEQDQFTVYFNDTRAGSFYDYSKNMLEGYFAFAAWQESGQSSCTFTDTWVWSLAPGSPNDPTGLW